MNRPTIGTMGIIAICVLAVVGLTLLASSIVNPPGDNPAWVEFERMETDACWESHVDRMRELRTGHTKQIETLQENLQNVINAHNIKARLLNSCAVTYACAGFEADELDECLVTWTVKAAEPAEEDVP